MKDTETEKLKKDSLAQSKKDSEKLSQKKPTPKKRAQKKAAPINNHSNQGNKNKQTHSKPTNDVSDNTSPPQKKLVQLTIDIDDLKYSNTTKLLEVAQKLEIENIPDIPRDELIFKVLHLINNNNGHISATGILEILPDGYGFLRISNYLPSSEDIYISQTQIRRFGLASGDKVKGFIRPPKEGERYFSLLRVESVNNGKSEKINKRIKFSNLTPIYPDEILKLETGQHPVSGRIIDMLSPIGKGQRALIVSPPKAGKTTILKEIANSISSNYPDVHIKVLLIDERPEEVTDMDRSVNGEVIYSTFDEPPEQHVRISELVLESSKRLVECGKDVVILLDSITRLARAYNLVVPPSGRTLSGGLDPSSLHKPKRFFGGARNIEGGGSLTIIATALVDTGSRMDDIIYEEFKGTGNMELHLERRLANRRVYPAIDIINSGTRKEELLIPDDVLKKTYLLRKNIDSESATEEMIRLLGQTKSNEEFLNSPIFS